MDIGLLAQGDGSLIERIASLAVGHGVVIEDVRALGEDMRVSSEEVDSFTLGTRISRMKERPALAYHGSVMRCERHDLVHALGLDVSIHAFPGGHGVSPAELDALLRWWLEK